MRSHPAATRLSYSDPQAVLKTDMTVVDNQEKPMIVGVLLLNLGGPETMEDVEGFLYNLFADPDIIRLPTFLSLLQKPIAYAIAKKRAPKSSAAYLSIGGGSPIVKYTKAQADLIQASLISKGLDAKCYFAMRYWNPYTEEVLDQMQKDEINTMVVVPLYPQYSISTSGSSLKLLEDIFYNQPEKWGPDKVRLCTNRENFVKLLKKIIRRLSSSAIFCKIISIMNLIRVSNLLDR
jgi:protoporphyrin/coproporphyrin ferrochelatase